MGPKYYWSCNRVDIDFYLDGMVTGMAMGMWMVVLFGFKNLKLSLVFLLDKING